jgi:RimJ/RimL family protein N-acetyltransferase
VRLERVLDAAQRADALAGRLDLPAAPGWPHDNSEIGLSFLDHGGLAFLIVDDEGRIAGDCGTKTPPSAAGVVEIGYGLAPASRGRGLGTRAIQALVDALASLPGARSVEAEVHESNEPSWRLLLALDFVEIEAADDHGFRRYGKPLTSV